MTTTFTSDILTLYQTFYNNKQVDLTESLAWLIANEKSMGISEDQMQFVSHLAHFYFEVLGSVRISFDTTWTYLNWLTQNEYDIIMYNRNILEY